MGSIDKILVVRASGGLSNRLQAVICGVAYCLLSGRSICVDWRDGLYSDDFSNVFPLWFNIEGIKSVTYQNMERTYGQDACIMPVFWHDWIKDPIAIEYLFEGNSHMQEANVARTAINIEQFDLKEDIVIFWSWDTSPLTRIIPQLKEKFSHLAKLNQIQIERYLLKTYVKPVQKLEQEAQDFFVKHFKNIPVGIHIRHTDLQSPLPQMLEQLKLIAGHDEKIFLCTDNEQVERMVQKIFPHTVTRPKIYQGPNIPLHSYVEGISNVQKGHDAILDMLLLSKCKDIIHYQRSSFARIPALLSNLEPKNIHALS